MTKTDAVPLSQMVRVLNFSLNYICIYDEKSAMARAAKRLYYPSVDLMCVYQSLWLRTRNEGSVPVPLVKD